MNSRKEFEKFMTTSQAQPPRELSDKVTYLILQDLNPSFQQTIPKFIAIQATAAVATLSICPQFGVGPLGGGNGIAHIFMSVGVWACALFCGLVFMGVGFLVSSLLMSSAELQLIQKKSMWLVPALGGTYVSTLMLISYSIQEQHILFSSQFVAFWMIGAIMSARLILKSVTLYKVHQSIK